MALKLGKGQKTAVVHRKGISIDNKVMKSFPKSRKQFPSLENAIFIGNKAIQIDVKSTKQLPCKEKSLPPAVNGIKSHTRSRKQLSCIEKAISIENKVNESHVINKTNDPILNLTPENVTQHSRIE